MPNYKPENQTPKTLRAISHRLHSVQMNVSAVSEKMAAEKVDCLLVNNSKSMEAALTKLDSFVEALNKALYEAMTSDRDGSED